MLPFHLLVFLYLLAFSRALIQPRFPGPSAQGPARANAPPLRYEYETRFFRQRLDHFSFREEEPGFYQQRYLVGGADGWAGPGGPVFFYCGNEGDIAWFAANSGFVWEAAPRFAALVVFAEHRYYGESMPFGSKEKAYNNSRSLAYLTAEQALADYAVLLIDLKRNLSSEGSPVVLFGGSYGGMLAAWMRLKYPHIAIGAVASSAPILQFEDIVPSSIFYDLVSNDFRRESLSCFQTIKASWKALDDQGNRQDGLLKLSKTFHLCRTLKRIGELSDWLQSAYSYLAMVDYPIPSDFLMALPANPIKEVCRNIDSQPEGTSILERIYAGVNIYYNYTGTVECFDLNDDPHGMSGWNWQACTEMVMPMSSSEENSMFPPNKFDYAAYEKGCLQKFGVRPRPRWITTEFGGHAKELNRLHNSADLMEKLAFILSRSHGDRYSIWNNRIFNKNISTVLRKFGSNIIFFNGLLDPWSGGSVLQNISESIVALVAPLGAHHIDLRPATREDPDWLVQVRNSEIEIISGWLSDYYAAKGALIQRVAHKHSAVA